MKNCPECGYVEEDNSVPYCLYCGNPIILSWSGPQPIDEDDNKIQIKKKLTKKIRVSLLGLFIILIILGTSFSFITFNSSTSPTITINSITTSPLVGSNFPYSNYPILQYALTINLKINFSTSKKLLTWGMTRCDFGLNVQHNSKWEAQDQAHHCPQPYERTYFGSYSVQIPFIIGPIKNSNNYGYPFMVELSVNSSTFHLKSKPYSITINSSGFATIKVLKSEFNNETADLGMSGYNISTDFSVITDHNINLKTSCFHLTLKKEPSYSVGVASLPWNIINSCQLPVFATIPAGITYFSISSQVMDPSGNLYNYSSQYILPTVFTFQITSGQNLISSNFISVYPYINSTAN